MKQFITLFALMLALCVLCYVWVDRPLAVFMSQFGTNGLGNFDLADALTYLAYGLVMLSMAWYTYERLVTKKGSTFVNCIGLTNVAISVAYFIKSNLQFLLGRLSPHYSGSKTLLFVRNPHLYGFHFFQNGSFPSGHMCVFTAMLAMICYFYPKLQSAAIFLLFALASLLIFYNYHFMSDVIAGTYLGVMIAGVLYRLNRSNEPTIALCSAVMPTSHRQKLGTK